MTMRMSSTPYIKKRKRPAVMSSLGLVYHREREDKIISQRTVIGSTLSYFRGILAS